MNHFNSNLVINYFAFGSNMNPARMRERGVIFYSRQHLVLPGYSLKFHKIAKAHCPNAGAANIVPDKNGLVEGILYKVTWTGIRNLDKYEGYPTEYDRVNLKVPHGEGVEKEIVTYVAHPHKTREGLKPTRDYLNHLLAAEELLSEYYFEQLKRCETLD